MNPEGYIAENLKPEGRFEVEQFRFSDFFHPLSRRAEPGTRTDFLGMLVSRIPELESRGFNGVFWLTDGIDTVGRAETDAAFSALADSQMRHFFIPMTAPLEAPPSVALKKIEAPAQAYLNTEIPLTLLVRRVNISKKRNARLVLSRNGVTLGEFQIGPGTGVQTIQHRVAVRNIGTDRFTAELFLDGKRAETQSWTVAGVTRRNTRRILVYNGALEYGNRFLRNIFLNDPSVKLDIVFAPGVIQGRQAGEPVRLDDRLSLEKYDVLVLFNLNRKQITPEMERVLRRMAAGSSSLPEIRWSRRSSPIHRWKNCFRSPFRKSTTNRNATMRAPPGLSVSSLPAAGGRPISIMRFSATARCVTRSIRSGISC